MRKIGLILLAVAFLAACGSLPRGAAITEEILQKTSGDEVDFTVYVVDKKLLPVIAKWPRTGTFRYYNWVNRRAAVGTSVIAAGDRVNLAIWDSEDNSLLTAPEQRAVVIDEIVVSPDGSIFLPYVDRVYISGLTAEAAREKIQSRLENIVPSAQVQLTLNAGRLNSVDLVGGVSSPGNYPMPSGNFTVLNLISLGGGVATSMRNPQVRLVRGRAVYGTSLSRLYLNPGSDTVVQGGDKVIIEEDKRYFLALGASGEEKITYFEHDRTTALDALSMIGGLQDSRANPQGILILREYTKKSVRSDGTGPEKARTIFTIDLTTADGLFSAGKFEINPGDLVLATESPIVSLRTILGLFGTGLGLAARL